MNYKIFQNCFEEDQIKNIDPLLTPFDNTANERPDLREFQVFDKIYRGNYTKDLDAWGVFGPRWHEKLKYPMAEVHDEIQNNPGHDVYIFNFARITCAYFYSVWEQGELGHKGIIEISRHALKNIFGHDRMFKVPTYQNTMCFSNFFVASKDFWYEYMNFLYEVKNELDNLPEELDIIYKSSANYERDMSLNLFPFIIERMFSTYLIMNPKWKVHFKPYDYDVYSLPEKKILAPLLNALNGIKRPETMDHWLKFRDYFFAVYPHFLNLEK